MSDLNHHSDEPEEQIDLEGDNEEEDMIDDDERDQFNDYDPQEDADPDEDDEQGPESGRDGDAEGDEMGEEDKQGDLDVGPEDEEERKKWEELMALPPHGAEVFIGGLPRETTEDDLRELCDSFGEIFEVRLVKDKETKENKGFAFVTFKTKEAAQSAIEDVHEKEFKGRTLRCSVSQVKHRLFVGNVPKGLSEEDLQKIFKTNCPGVDSIEFFKDQQDPSRNRGFLFIEFYNHACAEHSRQKLSNSSFKVEGSNLTVTWADPKSSSESAASQVKTLYIKNLPENVAKETLKEVFEKHGEVTRVVLPPGKPGQKRDFGFVHFAERSSALKACKGSEKYEIDGQVLEVCMAKPQTDRSSHKGSPASNFPPYPSYSGYSDPYGAYGGGRGSGGYSQPMIYGRGPMPSGMRMVPMVLPDGRLGYVLQQPGGHHGGPPPRRGGRGGPSDGGGRGGGRRYRPY
ncbi:RNA-binding (RRM/RBD/RNP motifs) family protein [Rhynchospora pubera]|uniref:RNA-binding (RRM/RBD/RNP motifs) family protein n=1 Tax=Rhynchospora pubera TaxID=906938 RepID=A0AAV8GFN0_9POAL|nr:RNA-binding (RRM/RBD/RNP motifs) family protein [Rhynchospora pubera]KAJ4777115.1 RNA-binding (RRM/RBD/RNP motifs) family protein [Rhynchospora pubera]KAJ4803774.1 RNA-binding (RRM/RBD/RNP motifs) family protein [Rhynchospora pubera]